MEVQLSSGENVPLPVLKRLSDKHLTLNVLFFFLFGTDESTEKVHPVPEVGLGRWF